MNYCTTLFSFVVILFLAGCDKKVEDARPNESLLRLKQIAEQFNAKITSNDIEEFCYTADFQDYFSDPKQHFAFDLWPDDILKQNDTIMGKFISESDAILFLKMNQEMLRTIRAYKDPGETFIVIATIDRIYKPFFGLTGNVEDFEIEYVDIGYGESYPIIEGNFYIEVVNAPIVLYGKCVFIEHKK